MTPTPPRVTATAQPPVTAPKAAAPAPAVVINSGLAQKDLAAKQTHVDALGQDMQNQSNMKAQAAADQKAQAAAAAAMPPAPPTPPPAPTADDIAKSMLNQSGVTTPTTAAPVAPPAPPSPTDQLASSLNDINAKTDQAFQDYQQSLAQLQNGTFPLTADQQAQVDSANALLQQSVDDQKTANAAYQAGINKAGAVSGRSMYAPEVQMGELKGAIDQGIKKVTGIEATALDNIAKLKAGFQTQDYTLINDQYKALTDNLAAKSKAITDIYTAVQNAADKTQQYNLDVQKQNDLDKQNAIDNTLKQQTNDLASAKDAADQKIALANSLGYWTDSNGNKISTEAAIKDAQTQLTTAQDEALKQAQLNLDTQKENFTEQQAADPLGLAGAPQTIGTLVSSGVAEQLSDGSAYLDTSQFSDAKQKAAAENIARQAGIPIISSAAEKTGLTSLDSETQNLKYLLGLFDAVGPQDATARLGQASTQWAGLAADTPQAQLVKQYQALTGVELPGLVKSVTGLARVNSSELQSAAGALPSMSPTSMDTVADAKLKVQAMLTAIGNQKSALLDNKEVYADPTSYYSNASQAQKDYFDKARAANPTWTPDEVLQFVQGGSSGFNQESQTSSKGTSPLVSSNPDPTKVIAGYDFTNYATDPAWGKGVGLALNQIGDASTPDQVNEYISQQAPDSPYAGHGAEILATAQKYGIEPPTLMVAIMQHESQFGTKGAAVATKNVGNVGNVDSGATKDMGTWQAGLDALAENISKRKI